LSRTGLPGLRCLCYGPPLPDKQPISQAAEQEQVKNPPAAGKSSEKESDNDSGKDVGNGKQTESKNPPGENDNAGKENGKESDKEKEKEKEEVQWYSAHAQATVVTQAHDPFKSPYIGPNSLQPHEPSATSMTGRFFWTHGSGSVRGTRVKSCSTRRLPAAAGSATPPASPAFPMARSPA
jgi:hypothetical protein